MYRINKSIEKQISQLRILIIFTFFFIMLNLCFSGIVSYFFRADLQCNYVASEANVLHGAILHHTTATVCKSTAITFTPKHKQMFPSGRWEMRWCKVTGNFFSLCNRTNTITTCLNVTTHNCGCWENFVKKKTQVNICFHRNKIRKC